MDTIIRVTENTPVIISTAGTQGPRGITGETGPTGVSGAAGPIGATGDDFVIDATGPYTDRVLYDEETAGYAFLATDSGTLFYKYTSVSGVWGRPYSFW